MPQVRGGPRIRSAAPRDEDDAPAPPPRRNLRDEELMPWSFMWIRRKFSAYAFGTVICGALMMTLAAWMGGGLGQFGKKMDAGFTVILHSAGLTVEKIEVLNAAGEPVDDLVKDRVLKAADLGAGKSMLSADPYDIKKRVEKLETVGSVSVHRLWPDQVTIVADARKPMALWRKDGQWAVVDQRGHAFAAASSDEYLHLPKLEGEGAPAAAPSFITLLSDYPDLAGRMELATRVGERRWDVRFKGGVDVALPEDGRLREALSSLNLLNARNRVLDMPVTRIDARHPERFALRPTPGAPTPPGGV